MSLADPNRSAGDFRRHRATHSITAAGTYGHRSESGRASLSSTRATIASGVAAAKGCTPLMYSYSTAPNAKTSDAGVDHAAIQLLGGHVRRRPEQESRLGDERPRRRAALETREAEVQDLQPAITRSHDVFRFQIAMHDAARVRFGERARDLPGRPHNLGRRRPPSRCDLFAKRGAVDEFGDDEQLVVDFLERVDGADSRMGERRGRPRFPPQPLALHRIARQVRRERFDRDLPPEPRVRREIHAPHPAAADFPDDRVGAERRSRHQHGVVGQEIGHAFDDRLRQEITRAEMMFEQRDDFVLHHGIVGSLAGHPGRPLA